MKLNFTSAVVALGVLIGSAQSIASTRSIASAIDDVGVVGPDGQVSLFYRYGENIIVKKCPGVVLGNNSIEARNKCNGEKKSIPVDSFKLLMKALISNTDSMSLQPLSSEEVEEYLKKGPSVEEIERIDARLKEIEDLITAYGEGNAPLKEKMKLENDQRRYKKRKDAIEKVNSEVERVVAIISSQKGLELAKFDPDRHQFMYTILKRVSELKKVSDLSVVPCGLQGSVDERISDCSDQSNSQEEGFVLVTKSKDLQEVYMEVSTGLLWSDRLPETLTYHKALKACNDLNKVAGISGVTWRLPKIKEYKEAEKNGIRRALPNMNYKFWASSMDSFTYSYAWLFRRDGGYTATYYLNNNFSVRCVAR